MDQRSCEVFFDLLKYGLVTSTMDNGSSQGMISCGGFLRFVFEKMLGCLFRGWEVFRLDCCTIGENPLSMDGIFLEGIGFPGKGLVVHRFSSFWTEGLDA